MGKNRSSVFGVLRLSDGQSRAGKVKPAWHLGWHKLGGGLHLVGKGALSALETQACHLICFLKDHSGCCVGNGLEQGKVGKGSLPIPSRDGHGDLPQAGAARCPLGAHQQAAQQLRGGEKGG